MDMYVLHKHCKCAASLVLVGHAAPVCQLSSFPALHVLSRQAVARLKVSLDLLLIDNSRCITLKDLSHFLFSSLIVHGDIWLRYLQKQTNLRAVRHVTQALAVSE